MAPSSYICKIRSLRMQRLDREVPQLLIALRIPLQDALVSVSV